MFETIVIVKDIQNAVSSMDLSHHIDEDGKVSISVLGDLVNKFVKNSRFFSLDFVGRDRVRIYIDECYYSGLYLGSSLIPVSKLNDIDYVIDHMGVRIEGHEEIDTMDDLLKMVKYIVDNFRR